MFWSSQDFSFGLCTEIFILVTGMVAERRDGGLWGKQIFFFKRHVNWGLHAL